MGENAIFFNVIVRQLCRSAAPARQARQITMLAVKAVIAKHAITMGGSTTSVSGTLTTRAQQESP